LDDCFFFLFLGSWGHFCLFVYWPVKMCHYSKGLCLPICCHTLLFCTLPYIRNIRTLTYSILLPASLPYPPRKLHVQPTIHTIGHQNTSRVTLKKLPAEPQLT
jgi:hypothetical protein